jgi:hypothetical protein
VDRPSTYGRMLAGRAKCCCGGACYIIPGISTIRTSATPGRQRKRARNQFLTDEFPTHPNRGVFCDLQGIKSGDQGNFHPDQGIPLSPLFWGLLPCRQSDRPDRSRTVPRRRTGRRQMLEVAEADLEHGFVHPQACRKSLAERVDANDRAFRDDGGVGRVARARVHRAHRRGGPRDAMGRAAR